VFDETTRARALDTGFRAAQSTSGSGDLAYVTGVVDVLVGSSGGSEDPADPAGDEDVGAGGVVFLLVILAVIGVVVFVIVRKQKKT
ncbi:MAG: hypothetical protein GWN07_35905, partial [Actinobacteria bacterium]|nr:hypothetical protein [Actinomycetota bacterium]NIV90364.1 hypothetical protein [Actinomycetota bacterium]NIW32712.1 hypothetical protein [Actinomycetota bacterium]NIX24901.1 hypothetical protein [Actinomycetota bacterium]